MLMIANPTPDLEVDAARATFLLDPEGRVASVTANALEVGQERGRDAAARPGLPGGRAHRLRVATGDRLLVLA